MIIKKLINMRHGTKGKKQSCWIKCRVQYPDGTFVPKISDSNLHSGDQYTVFVGTDKAKSFDDSDEWHGSVKVRLDYKVKGYPTQTDEFFCKSTEKIILSVQDPEDEHENGTCSICWPDGFKDPFFGGKRIPHLCD